MGGYIAGASDEQIAALTTYGKSVGLAFQIADDLLDVEGDPDRVGKGVQKDDAAGKLTYPKLLGIEESRRQAHELTDDAINALRPLGGNASLLKALARYVVERDC